ALEPGAQPSIRLSPSIPADFSRPASWSTVLPKLGSYQAQIGYVEDNGQGGQWTALKGFTELTFDEGSTAATIVVPKGMQAQ
ncbi:MAG: hypothetical protein ACYSWX_09540, partial [Planctomycetota bacterium]